MPKQNYPVALFATLIGLTLTAGAASCELTTPTSAIRYVDTQAQSVSSLDGATDLTRKCLATIEMTAAPTNAVLVSVGHDNNEDGNLSWNETAARFGIDCGAITTEPGIHASAPNANSPSVYTFDLSKLFDRSWNLAKVTTYGNPTNVSVRIAFKNNPMVVVIR